MAVRIHRGGADCESGVFIAAVGGGRLQYDYGPAIPVQLEDDNARGVRLRRLLRCRSRDCFLSVSTSRLPKLRRRHTEHTLLRDADRIAWLLSLPGSRNAAPQAAMGNAEA